MHWINYYRYLNPSDLITRVSQGAFNWKIITIVPTSYFQTKPNSESDNRYPNRNSHDGTIETEPDHRFLEQNSQLETPSLQGIFAK